MNIEELRKLKKELGLTTEKFKSSDGIPVSAVQAFFKAVDESPEKLDPDVVERILPEEDGKQDGNTGDAGSEDKEYRFSGNHRDLIGEPEAAYGIEKEGGYTLEDYYALPDERRVELIDGVFYDMAAPAIVHQKILGDLFILFRECVDRHEGECEVFLSPCDVRLDMDNRTMVQPDLLVVCKGYDIDAKRFEGAPDLTLEILSPSTRSKDMVLKLNKYTKAGVREYWVVDPEQQTVLAYDLEKDGGAHYPRKYSFEDRIPIGISGGTCSIDFSRILRRLEK